MRALWINLKSSLWFIPALSVVFSAGLAIALVELDATSKFEFRNLSPQFFGLGADGSRSILATIAQSVITIAGVSFSITIVALSLAANQYTPRVLRNFMRDRGNQAVLGGLVGIFTYCIIVLRTIQGGEESFVPAVSVIVALVFSIVAIGLFIYFIHHVATSIQASSIISSIAEETQEVIREMFPKAAEQPARLPDGPQADEWHEIHSPRTGYLQTAELGTLAGIASKEGVVVEVLTAVGEFVLRDTPLLRGNWSSKPDGGVIKALQGCFNIQNFRTIEQDAAFGIRQIVDIAVKALSPGINDPTTAITCLNYLGAILNTVMERETPSPCRVDDGKVCVLMRPPSFESLVILAFEEIRHNCHKQPVVLSALFKAIVQVVNGREIGPERRLVLVKQARLILRSVEQASFIPEDLTSLKEQGREVLALLGQSDQGA